MRKLLTVVVATALLAVACGSDAPEPIASDTDTDSVAAAGELDAAPDDAESEQAADGAVVTEGDDVATCGFENPLVPEFVEVEQIPGNGRENNPSALENRAYDGFPEPLIDVERILNGGPPPDGIPPVDRPVFQTASTVSWLQCNEPVLSLRVGSETRAYPVQILTWHEIVNDTFGDQPVTVSYCPLCNSSLAYNRDLGDRVVTFGTSGRLFNSSLVMYDRETESLWTHFNGKAVLGTLTGTELELLPMQTTSWASFLESHPDGLVLTTDTGFIRRYGENPYAGYDDVNTNPFLFDGEYDDRLLAKERVVGIRSGGDSAAVVLESLAEAGVIATEVDGRQLTVWHLPGTATALESQGIADGRDIGAVGVYLPEADGQALTFAKVDDGFVDAETGTTWNIQGLAIDGPLAGEQLEAVEHLDTFWFALAAFEPDTRVIRS